ncbi:MAG: hypothetical protein JOZ95_12000 [Solirubrobacterales bacterium]|nr:hypothetical protein [Solirubrobacterales bacterium]
MTNIHQTHMNRARALRVLMLLAVTLTSWVALAGSAKAVGVPITIDSFGNPNVSAGPFTRTVIPLPAPHTSTTPQGTFSQSNGVATLTMSGAGNGISGSTLQYTSASGDPVDLTGGGTNAQIFIDFALINQMPAASDFSPPGVTTYISATDGNGNTAISPSDGVGNAFAFNAAFPFSGFQGTIDWTRITQLAFSFVYPISHTGGGSLEVQVNKLWATPLGGAPPTPPVPTVTAPPSAIGFAGATVDFTVSFGNSEGAAPVTHDPPSSIGLRAQDLMVSGSAFGTAIPVVQVSGGPSTYTVAVSGMTQSGGITVDVPAGVVDDAWNQLNSASTNDPTASFTYGVPPQFRTSPTATFTVGAPPAMVTIDATGGQPAPTPTPTLSIASGSLPAGLTFKDNGDGTATLSGSPAAGTGGVFKLTLRASNVAGAVSQPFGLTIDEAPSITSAATATFGQGMPGTFTVTTGAGFPTPSTLSITSGALPTGVQFNDNGDGTATIVGTPAAGSVGTYQFTVTAANGTSPAASQQFTLTVAGPAPPVPRPTGSAPSNSTLPTVTGQPIVGGVLSASPGQWSGTPVITFGYQWQRCASTCANIPDATTTSYTVASGDIGLTVRVVVTATNGIGSTQATSSEVGPVIPAVTPPTTAAETRAALVKLLTLPQQERIREIRLNRGYTGSFNAPSAGQLTVQWHKRGLVASGSVIYTIAGTEKITVTLTRYGGHLLRDAHKLTLTASGSFTPSGGPAITVEQTITLRQ